MLGASVVLWKTKMKRLRDKLDAAKKDGKWDQVKLVEQEQIALAKRLNERYHTTAKQKMQKIEQRPVQ